MNDVAALVERELQQHPWRCESDACYQAIAQLARHPRFHLHFTSTNATWLKLVKHFPGESTSTHLQPLICSSPSTIILSRTIPNSS